MARVGYDPAKGRIKTDAKTSIDRAFIARVEFSDAEAVAENEEGIGVFTLQEEESEVEIGITNPPCARNMIAKANVAGVLGNATVIGKSMGSDSQEETFAISGTAKRTGTPAFAAIEKIQLPARTHTPVYQVAKLTMSAGAGTASGTITVTVTAAGVEGSPKAVAIEVEKDDTAAAVATIIAEALNTDEAVHALFNATADNVDVLLTANTYRANDATLAMAFEDTDTTGCAGAAGAGTSGVVEDKIKIGFGVKLGLPYKLTHNTLLKAFFGTTEEAESCTIAADAEDLGKNTLTMNSALNGTAIEAFLLV